jgi:hypothetical protein
MKVKLAAAIVFILCGCAYSTVAQSTAYANIYAEIVEIAGIENSAEPSPNEFTPLQNSISVVLISDEEMNDPYIEPLHVGSSPLASFKIQGGSSSTYYLALTKGSETETEQENNPLNLQESNDPAKPPGSELKNSDLIKSGSILIYPVNLPKGEINADCPFLVTLNFN